jgi:general secretion pathway protein B
MSLILDALRKMDLERKARRQNSPELRAEVLNYRGAVPAAERSGIFRSAAGVLIASAAAAGIFYVARPEPRKSEPVKAAESPGQEQSSVIQVPPAQLSPAQPLPDKPQPVESGGVKEAQELAARTLKASRKIAEEKITVSGIAWQDERYLRRAVINGALVGEGAEILGARVVEIRENRVRFDRGGEIFEVVHSSGSDK